VPNCGKTISSGKKSVKKYTLLTFEQLKRLEERSNKPHSEQNTDIMWLVNCSVSGYTDIRVEHICSDNTLAQGLVNLFNQQVRNYTHENVS